MQGIRKKHTNAKTYNINVIKQACMHLPFVIVAFVKGGGGLFGGVGGDKVETLVVHLVHRRDTSLLYNLPASH